VPLLTSLPPGLLEAVLEQLDPRSIARARLACRAIRDCDFWRLAYEVRWCDGADAPHAKVGQVTYALRHTCEARSRDGALCAARTEAEFARSTPRELAEEEEENQDMWYEAYELEQVEHTPHATDVEQTAVLETLRTEIERIAPSEVCADALLAAFDSGLCVLSSNDFEFGIDDSFPHCRHARTVKFAVWSARGDLTVFHSRLFRQTNSGIGTASLDLQAHIVGVPDATLPRASKFAAFPPEPEDRDDSAQEYADWFDGLLRLDWADESTHEKRSSWNMAPLLKSKTPGSTKKITLLHSNVLYAFGSLCGGEPRQELQRAPCAAEVSRLYAHLGLDIEVRVQPHSHSMRVCLPERPKRETTNMGLPLCDPDMAVGGAPRRTSPIAPPHLQVPRGARPVGLRAAPHHQLLRLERVPSLAEPGDVPLARRGRLFVRGQRRRRVG
jgi:hypothetical protein